MSEPHPDIRIAGGDKPLGERLSDIEDRQDRHDARLSSLERFQAFVVGAVGVVSFLFGYLVKLFKNE